MRMAIGLAERGWYSAAPNPRVGCVLVDRGEMLGCGWHERTGGAHAEAIALARAQGRARGATAYVNLEPCAHTGHTPPCCDALVRAGVGRVVVAMQDPNPQVSGRGLAYLRKAGIEVRENVLRAAAEHLNSGFVRRHSSQRPRVVAKLAMSADGRVAMRSGESRWITGERARAEAQDMRASSCAILTGIGTVLADNPRFSVRPGEWRARYPLPADGSGPPQPLVVVADSALRLPPQAAVRRLGSKLLVATGASSRDDPELNLWRSTSSERAVDLHALLDYLARERQCNNLLVECGPKLFSSLLLEQLVDEVCLYVAPVFLGGSAQPVCALSIDRLRDKLKLDVVEQRPVGVDWLVRALPGYPDAQRAAVSLSNGYN